jgi:exosortase/archaeosortase family protein
MTPAGRAFGGPWRFTFWQTMAAAAATLLAGFLLIQTPPAQAFFGAVAIVLASCATGLLGLAGHDMVRTGVEIRDIVSGHAVAVTSACDGSGLLVSLAAALVAVAPFSQRRRSWPLVLAAALAAILLFNLARILALFQAIGSPRLMNAEHLYAAPLLSAVLVGALALAARRAAMPSALRWGVVSLAVAAGWYMCREAVTCATVVPLANALLWLSPSGIASHIACSPAGELVTNAPLHNGGAVRAAFFPEDFTLALPLVAASLATLARPAAMARGAAVAVALFTLGMALAALTAGHDAAIAAGAKVLGVGGVVQPYRAPGAILLPLMKAAQDVVVHFNLFLLPILLALAGRQARPDPAAPTPAPRKPRNGPRRRKR